MIPCAPELEDPLEITDPNNAGSAAPNAHLVLLWFSPNIEEALFTNVSPTVFWSISIKFIFEIVLNF